MGLGHVARYAHVPAIASSSDLKLAAIYEPIAKVDPGALDLSGDVSVCSDEQQFFAQNLDAIVVTSPAPYHADNIRSAMRHNLPILCEKPLADKAEDADRIVTEVQSKDHPLYIAYCYRFSSVAQRMRELIQRGAIGEVKLLRLVYNWDLHGMYVDRDADAGQIDSRWHGRMIEGGPMVDCGVHQIDLAQWWTDSPVVHVGGHGVWGVDYEAPSHVWGHLDHANGLHTCVEMSCTFGHTCQTRERDFRYEAMGTEGVIVFDAVAERFEWKHTHGEEVLPLANEKNFVGMYDAFALALRTGQHGDLCSAQQGFENTRIAWEILAHAHQHRLSRTDAPSENRPDLTSVK